MPPHITKRPRQSEVRRHVALYWTDGEEALIPQRRGPKVPATLTPARID